MTDDDYTDDDYTIARGPFRVKLINQAEYYGASVEYDANYWRKGIGEADWREAVYVDDHYNPHRPDPVVDADHFDVAEAQVYVPDWGKPDGNPQAIIKHNTRARKTIDMEVVVDWPVTEEAPDAQLIADTLRGWVADIQDRRLPGWGVASIDLDGTQH